MNDATTADSTRLVSHRSFSARTQRIALYAAICCLGALPSFFFGMMGNYDVAGMLVGIAVCFAIYLIVGDTDLYQRVRLRPGVKNALSITYGSRLILNGIIPIGGTIDMITGRFTIEIIESVFGRDRGFFPTLSGTLLQGVLLHVQIVLLLLVVYLFTSSRFAKEKSLEGLCKQCHYNLTGNVSGICPECGTPVAPSVIQPA